MKKTNLVFILMLSIGLVLSSCSKDDDDDGDNGGNNPTPTQGTMTLKIDGADWNASLAVVATHSGGVFSVTGSDASSKQCGITANGVNGTGSYELGGSLTNPNMGRWTIGTGQADTYTTLLGQGSGTLNINVLTETKTEGTFEFTAKNGAGETVTISSGTFSTDISK